MEHTIILDATMNHLFFILSPPAFSISSLTGFVKT